MGEFSDEFEVLMEDETNTVNLVYLAMLFQSRRNYKNHIWQCREVNVYYPDSKIVGYIEMRAWSREMGDTSHTWECRYEGCKY